MTVTATIIDARYRAASDEESHWVSSAAKGDRQAYHKLYQVHVGAVYALCLRLLADQSAAEDVCQETFVQAWLKLSHFRGESKFSTWLHRVASNQVFTHMRQQRNWLQRVLSLDETPEITEPAVDLRELGDLDRQILRLPVRARQVFVLFAIEGYRHEEIANIMGIAVGSSKAQYHRARQLLQEWVEQ